MGYFVYFAKKMADFAWFCMILHFSNSVYIMSGQTFTKNAKNGQFLASFWNPEACGQTVLPGRSLMYIRTKISGKYKINIHRCPKICWWCQANFGDSSGAEGEPSSGLELLLKTSTETSYFGTSFWPQIFYRCGEEEESQILYKKVKSFLRFCSIQHEVITTTIRLLLSTVSTVFENHSKCRIRNCERS